MRLLAPEKPFKSSEGLSEAARNFDPFDPSYLLDPYEVLTSQLAAEPVFYAPSIQSWMVLRHKTIAQILRDPKRFSPAITSDPLVPLCPHAVNIVKESEFDVPPLLVNNGGPDHPRYRKFFGEPLKPANFRALEPFIRDTVDFYIDRMIERGGPVDLAADLCWDLPALVVFRLLGIPDADIPHVKNYADSRVVLLWGRPSEEEQIRLTQGALDFFRYTSKLVHDRVENPRDDYPSQLLGLRNGDDSIATVPEIIATTFNLLFAGHETTSSACANVFNTVLARRDVWNGLVDGTLSVPMVVEEALRFDPPVQAWRRLAMEDVEVDGVKIPAGSHLLLAFAAGNRDPEKFEAPNHFDPERANAQQHLTFGMGAHFCLGAPLGRLEIAIMMEHLVKRLPGLRISPESKPDYLPNTTFRGLRSLLVEW